MSNILKLPIEIVRLILAQLDSKDLKDIKQCALTCQIWKTIAQEIIFSTITIKDDGEVNKLLERPTANPTIGKLVKTLDYNPDEVISENHVANLFVFARIFPNLEEFRDTVPSELFISCFHRLLADGDFPRLKILPKPFTKAEDKIHVSNLMCIKDRVTNLNLWRDDRKRRDTFTPLHNELYRFTQLHSISININTPEPQSIMDYMETLNTVTPSLRKADFQFSFPHIFNTRSNIILPISHLKHLTINFRLSLLLGFDTNMIYLMKKFPHLLSFSIKNSGDSNSNLHPENYTVPSIEIIDEFLKYIGKVPTHDLQYFVCDALDAGKATEGYYNSTHNSQLHLIKDTLTLQRDVGSFTLDGNATFAVHYNIYSKERKVVVNFHGNESVERYFDVLQETSGHQFKRLELTNNPALSTLALIDRALDLCPHITHLSIYGPAVELIEDNFEDKKHNLKHLELEDFTKDSLPYISNRFPTLETLSLCKFEISDTSADGLLRVSLDTMSLQKLILKIKAPDFNNLYYCIGIFLKLFTFQDQKTKYFFISINNSEYYDNPEKVYKLHEEPTVTEYDESIDDDDYLNYEIACYSVDKLVLEHGMGKELLLCKYE